MPVSSSYKDEKNKYSVKSSKNKTIIATNMAGNASNIVVRGSYVTSNTSSTSTSKVNGNTVTDNYKERSVNDKYQTMELIAAKQDTFAQQKIQESMAKYAGIYTEAEQRYIDKITSSNEIIGRNYSSNIAENRNDNLDLRSDYKKTPAYIKASKSNTEFKTFTDEEVEKRIESIKRSNELRAAVTDHETYTEEQIEAAKARLKEENRIRGINNETLDTYRSSTVYGVSEYSNKTVNGLKMGDVDDAGHSNAKIEHAYDKPQGYAPLKGIIGSGGRYMNLKYKTGFSDTMAADTSNYFRDLFRSSGLWEPDKINHYKNFYRFGALNPTFSLSNCKEYLFFTKTDLNIYPRNNKVGSAGNPGSLNSYLASQPFWMGMLNNGRYKDVIKMLQKSLDPNGNPFNFLLQNNVQSNLDLPNIAAESIDTPANMYGVNYDYRGSSEASNDSFQFSLEFRDTKWLPVYHYFKAYDEYQTIKHHGYLPPWYRYISNKILYDHFSIYKILVDDDMETIIYYAKLYGVKPMSVPREAFSNTDFANGLSYNVDFKAAFVRDMQPYIITDFNQVAKPYYDSLKYEIDVHNPVLDRPDNRPVMGAYIETVPYSNSYNGKNKGAVSAVYAPGGFVYKLRWKGNARV